MFYVMWLPKAPVPPGSRKSRAGRAILTMAMPSAWPAPCATVQKHTGSTGEPTNGAGESTHEWRSVGGRVVGDPACRTGQVCGGAFGAAASRVGSASSDRNSP
jgi:hypothetical protein